jgi:hypothetical protein
LFNGNISATNEISIQFCDLSRGYQAACWIRTSRLNACSIHSSNDRFVSRMTDHPAAEVARAI